LVELGSDEDRVVVPVVGSGPRDHLLHLERRPRSGGDDSLDDRVKLGAFLAPVLLSRVPLALSTKRERDGDVYPP
jgi:hypothetical protein